MPEISQVEVRLANALVAVVGVTRSSVSPTHVVVFLGHFCAVRSNDITIKRYDWANFLLVFSSRQLADQLLHMRPPEQADF
jgi:hypothetical protein